MPEPRIGVHLELGRGLRRASDRAVEIGARTVQLFVDNPAAWRRRSAPPRHLDTFRSRLGNADISPVTVHASYLVNLAGPEADFRARSIEVLAADMVAATGYAAALVNVHTGSHRDTTVEAGLQRVATGVVEVLARADDRSEEPVPKLVLENSAGGGWSVGTTIPELASIADRVTQLGVPEERLGFCLDVAHAWGAGVAMDQPEGIDAWLDEFDRELGLRRLALVHFNDSRSERGSRSDRHIHVGAGKIGPRGMAHLLTRPALANVPFILETPGMDVGYDAINLQRARALFAGESLEPLPQGAFELSRRAAASGPAEHDVDPSATGARRSASTRGASTRPVPNRGGKRRSAA